MVSKAKIIRIIDENIAEVQVERFTACGHSCDTCGGCSKKDQFITTTANINHNNIAVGDIVDVVSNTSNVLKGAVIMYILPLILFFVGYFVGSNFSNEESIKTIFAFTFFTLSIIFSFLYSKGISKTVNIDII